MISQVILNNLILKSQFYYKKISFIIRKLSSSNNCTWLQELHVCAPFQKRTLAKGAFTNNVIKILSKNIKICRRNQRKDQFWSVLLNLYHGQARKVFFMRFFTFVHLNEIFENELIAFLDHPDPFFPPCGLDTVVNIKLRILILHF